jgi:chorismate dehydratase
MSNMRNSFPPTSFDGNNRTPFSGERSQLFALFPGIVYTVGVRIGSVPYLNARPLVAGLERHPRADVTLEYATPAALVERLLDGSLDIAMASTFAELEHPELRLLPGMGITAAGPAWSVRLLSATPVRDIRTLALDDSSRSSNALARIVLADRYGVTPACLECAPDLPAMLARADAAVLIGDIGLAISGESLHDLDLGAEWWALTALPFFFAGWMSPDDTALERAAPLLFDALEQGLARLPSIAAEEAARLHLPEQRCYDYLTKVMTYRTGAAEEAGLAEFRRRAERLGLLDGGS